MKILLNGTEINDFCLKRGDFPQAATAEKILLRVRRKTHGQKNLRQRGRSPVRVRRSKRRRLYRFARQKRAHVFGRQTRRNLRRFRISRKMRLQIFYAVDRKIPDRRRKFYRLCRQPKQSVFIPRRAVDLHFGQGVEP